MFSHMEDQQHINFRCVFATLLMLPCWHTIHMIIWSLLLIWLFRLSHSFIFFWFYFFYHCTKVIRKLRTFCHPKIFIDNRKETEYAGFITHLHLLLHIVTLDNDALVVPWHQFTYSLLVPEGCLAILRYCKCSVTISYTTVRDTSGHCSYTSLIVKCRWVQCGECCLITDCCI